MRHMLFAASFGAALGLVPVVVNAQSVPVSPAVPGRALLDFPLGTLGEIPALATAAGGILSNPAAVFAGPPVRVRAALAHLDAPGDRGAAGEVATVIGLHRRTALAIGVARMGVSGLERTGDSDPQVLGRVPYYTYVASLVAGRRIGGPFRGHLALGVAGRFRAAHADTVEANTSALDVGLFADRLAGNLDGRVAVSSYLWTPGKEEVERPGIHVGADARVAGPDPAHEARVGLSLAATRGGTAERGIYVSGRWRFAEARAAVARATGFSDGRQTRTRLAAGFHATRFSVGVANESSAPNLGAMWQFTLSTRIR
jgi:hypothetical protein